MSDLSEHFQAGRLTAGEFDERMGRALAARTCGELRALLADLPAGSFALPVGRSLDARPVPWRFAPPPIIVLAGIAIAIAVLVSVAHGGLGFVWLLLPVLLIARRLSCGPRAGSVQR